MAETAERNPHKMTGVYLPTIPPKAPKAAQSYSRSVEHAPYTALMGVVVDGRQPFRHAVTPRCRVRNQVGCTNRWRLPESLGSDLLGTAQAVKAIRVPYNSNLINIITAENPKQAVNLDLEEPYTFRLTADRAALKSAPSNMSQNVMQGKLASRTQSRGLVSAPGPFEHVPQIPKVMPSTARPNKPLDIFNYHSKKSLTDSGPDVLLQCLGINWEIHRPYLQKSGTLSKLIQNAEDPTPKKYYRNKVSESLEGHIDKNRFYGNDYSELPADVAAEDVDRHLSSGVSHPKHVSEQRASNKTVISLNIRDAFITPQAMAIALGNLYHENIDVEVSDVVGVLAAAHVLNYKNLEVGCMHIMLNSISSATVCTYHEAANKYQQDKVRAACERWLEQNLVPELSAQIQLRQLPMSLLLKTLSSDRLFTFSEFWLYRTVATWVFLQLNHRLQLLPSYSTILTFFNSLPKSSALLEREEGQHFAPLFMAQRLHGVLDTTHIQDIQSMNIIPQTSVVKLLSNHYHSLQGGGDMTLLTTNQGPVRQGFIIDEEPHYHSEIMSLHGFHFELKAVKNAKKGCYQFYLQRLRPGDPILSFRQCERHTFSMRPDREVRYSIRVTYFDRSADCVTHTTGNLSQRFGLGSKTSKSEILSLDNLTPPLYVTFGVLFPPS